ncbi:Crp/Fnr family transcriptional regulator [uncultured Lacinutrix sp.]|uniref:Crp/Fnr family transcriptional regulator n=1 Tax=uncultured Lacinutrix sp. TaxID=574032 RepID=UPI002610F524|nr:Crp/Fnr family transcriptional regulator [uncultured Lacinutrix sp.]
MNSQPLLSYINKIVTLTEEEETYFTSKLVYRKYLKGQYILQQGDVSNKICFIVSGCVKMFYVDDLGQEHILMFGVENWWTSDLGSFVSQAPSDFNVQCIEDTELIQVSHNIIEDTYSKIPKLERCFRIIVEKAYVASQKRIVRNFSMSAKDRYLVFNESYPEIEQRIPQYMVASYLGITKEFLSKIKSQIATEK